MIEHPVMDFYLTLPSNGGGTEFNPTNNNTRYKVRLPNRLILKEQDWEVALVSLSFPIRDHHKHYMLSSFLRGTVVTKVYGRATFVTNRNALDEQPVHADVRIEDITDPDTNTDVTPVKNGMTFMRHWVFACKKAIQKAVLKAIQDDSTLKGARWGNLSNTQKGFQSFIVEISSTLNRLTALKTGRVFFGHAVMADGPVSTSSDNGSLENTSVELFSIKHDDPELENERLIWTSDLKTLKKFVEGTIQQHGKWSSPGGATETFKSDNNRLTITWYRGKQSTLVFQGKDGPLLKEQLVNLFQRNEAQKPIDDADSLLSNSTALQSGGQGRKQQVMAAGEGSGLDNCGCNGLSCELFAEMEGIKLQLVILQKQVEANTRSLSSNLQSEETIISEELQPLELARLRNENRALTQRLSDLENSYESLKREARSILDENKSLVTALRLLNNEIDKGNKHSIPEINKDDLHTDDRPSWEVDGTTLTTNNRFSVLSNCETVDEENVTTNGTILTTNNRLPVQGNRETIDKENESTRSQPKKGAKSRTQPESVLIIGDSLIKNIDSQKLTKKTVDKRMYSAKTRM